jgi:hypothetical protein
LPPPLAPSGGCVIIYGGPRRPVVSVGRLSGRACPRPWGEARGTSTCDVAIAASSCCGPATAAVTRDGLPIAVALAVATSTCRGPVTEAGTRDGSPVAAALAPVRVTLAERRPIVAGAPDLSALAGMMARMISITKSTREQKSKRQPLEIKGTRGEMLLTSSWRNPASSSSRAEGYLRRARWRLRGACWRLHRQPGGGRFRTHRGYQFHGRLPGPWRRGQGVPPIGGGPPPITLLLLIRRPVRQHRRRGESLLLMQPVLLVVLLQALPLPEPLLLRARHPLLFPPLRGVGGPRARGVGGSDRAACTVTLC